MTKTLLTVPVELRQRICSLLFSSTVARSGFGTTSSTHTSILRTCRQIYNEAQPLLARHVSFAFCFPSTATMLDRLSIMPPEDISKIRHIQLKGFPFPLHTNESYYTTYDMSKTLALFPGLALDLLMVFDPYHDPGVNDGWGDVGTYCDIEGLIKSNGWKELHYVSPTTEFMTSPNDANDIRVRQPAAWDELLKSRDGSGSGAEVRMYVADEPQVAGMAADPRTRTAYEPVPGHLRPDGEPEPGSQVTGVFGYDRVDRPVDAREVLVVAKRGEAAHYAQDGSDLNKDIKRLWDSMGWEELKESGCYIPPEDDPCGHL